MYIFPDCMNQSCYNKLLQVAEAFSELWTVSYNLYVTRSCDHINVPMSQHATQHKAVFCEHILQTMNRLILTECIRTFPLIYLLAI